MAISLAHRWGKGNPDQENGLKSFVGTVVSEARGGAGPIKERGPTVFCRAPDSRYRFARVSMSRPVDAEITGLLDPRVVF
jgi:hypothetical protein